MAGETLKTEAVCLRIYPWSRTSHIVHWLTPRGRLATVVKGATRPKSAFLGQYDLNYTCEIVYYLGSRGDLHALRECSPEIARASLRGNLAALLLADHMRSLAWELAPSGHEAREWLELLSESLDGLDARACAGSRGDAAEWLSDMLSFEMEALRLSGLSPEIEADSGSFALRGERRLPISEEVARCLHDPASEKNTEILLDAARAIGVFYTFHLDCPLDGRRSLIKAISQNANKTGKQNG